MAHALRFNTKSMAMMLTQASVTNMPARGFLWFGNKNIRLPNDTDHSTGEERAIRLAIERGIKDPFDVEPSVRGPGTKDNPNIVQTFQESRMIGCKCEEDSSVVKFMWVHLGDPKRCECGFWFKAVPARKFWEEVADK